MPATKIDVQKIIGRLKEARTQIETLIKDRSWMEEAKKVAEKQGQEVKKILDGDVAKLKAFLEKEKKELEKLQASIPGEVEKLKKFVDTQKQELTKLLGTVKAKAETRAKSAKGAAKAKASEARTKATEAANRAKTKATEAKAKATQAAEKVTTRVKTVAKKSAGPSPSAKKSEGASTGPSA